jgi:hypothetical protein
MVTIARPPENEYASYYARYVARVPENDVLSVLEDQVADVRKAAAAVYIGSETYRYGEGKWSIREVFGHLVDAERIFGYRAFCISRGEQAPLPAWDENAYVAASGYDACALKDLVTELTAVRQINTAFLQRLTDVEWLRLGTASGKNVSVRAIAFVLAGHVRHHLEIVRTRYGIVI